MAKEFSGIDVIRRENTKALMEKAGVKRKELAEGAGIDYGLLGHYIGKNPSKRIGDETASKIEGFFKKPKNWLDHEHSEIGQIAAEGDNFKIIPKGNVRQLPVLNYVQAGKFCEYHEDAIADEYLTIEGDYGDNAYIVIIEGKSMEPDFYAGEMVIVDPDLQPNPSDFVIALSHNDKKTTFKKYRPKGFDEHGMEYYQLIPSNPDYPIIDSRHEPFSICAVAVERKQKLR